MSAGLPGLGLGGLFFVLSALLAPLVELRRTLRGESSATAWKGVARQFAIAVVMIVAVDLVLRAFLVVAAAEGAGGADPMAFGTVLPLTPVGITMAILATLLSAAKLLQLALRVRPRRARRGRRGRPAPAVSHAAD